MSDQTDPLAATRAAIQKARGLTDKQAARLVGITPEELEADAVEMFGPSPDLAKMSAAEIRRRAKELWPQ